MTPSPSEKTTTSMISAFQKWANLLAYYCNTGIGSPNHSFIIRESISISTLVCAKNKVCKLGEYDIEHASWFSIKCTIYGCYNGRFLLFKRRNTCPNQGSFYNLQKWQKITVLAIRNKMIVHAVIKK